jgi:hypothetical protein
MTAVCGKRITNGADASQIREALTELKIPID